MTPREKFDRLRAEYLAARDRREELEAALRRRYGPGFRPSWAKVSEQRKLEKLHDEMSRARGAGR